MRYIVKHLSILLLICITALYMPFYVFAASTPVIEGNAISAQIGERVEVVFNISGAENVCGGNFNVVYNSVYLQLVGAKAGNALAASSPVVNTKYETGKIRVTWAGITPIEESGVLVTAEFIVKENAPSGALSVDIENIKLYDYDAQALSAQVTGAKIDVKNTYLVMLPENNGDKVSVSVKLDGDNNCSGGNFVLSYDNTALSPVSVGKGALLTGAMVTENLSYTSNSIKVSWARIDEVTEKGELFKIVFDITEDFSGDVKFSIDDATLYDENSKALVVQTEEVSFLIEEITTQVPNITVDKVKCQTEGTISVSIDKNSMVCGGSVEISYDNTAVEITDVVAGEALSGKAPAINKDYEQNVIKLSWASALPMTASGDILKISFKVKDAAKNFSKFEIKNINLYDADMVSVSATHTDGYVVINGEMNKCMTSTVFAENENSLTFASDILNAPEKAKMLIALYKGGKLVKSDIKDLSGEDYAEFIMDKNDFDKAKVMIWSSENVLLPITKAELVKIN